MEKVDSSEKTNNANHPIQTMVNTFKISAMLAMRVFQCGNWHALFKKKFCIISMYGDITTYENAPGLLSEIEEFRRGFGPQYIASVIINGYSYLLKELDESNINYLISRKTSLAVNENKEVILNFPLKKENEKETVRDLDEEVEITDDFDDNDDLDVDMPPLDEEESFYVKMQHVEWIVQEYEITEELAKLILANHQGDNIGPFMYITSDGIVQSAVDEDDLKEKILECMHAPGIFDIEHIFVDDMMVDVDVDIKFQEMNVVGSGGSYKDSKKNNLEDTRTIRSAGLPDQLECDWDPFEGTMYATGYPFADNGYGQPLH